MFFKIVFYVQLFSPRVYNQFFSNLIQKLRHLKRVLWNFFTFSSPQIQPRNRLLKLKGGSTSLPFWAGSLKKLSNFIRNIFNFTELKKIFWVNFCEASPSYSPQNLLFSFIGRQFFDQIKWFFSSTKRAMNRKKLKKFCAIKNTTKNMRSFFQVAYSKIGSHRPFQVLKSISRSCQGSEKSEKNHSTVPRYLHSHTKRGKKFDGTLPFSFFTRVPYRAFDTSKFSSSRPLWK